MNETGQKQVSARRRLWRIVQIVIGLAAFGILFSGVDLGKLFASFRDLKWGWVILVLPMPFVVHCWTWISHVYLLKIMRRPQKGIWFYRVFLLSQGISMAAPGKLGDFSIIWFLKKRGVRYSEGLALAFYYKLIALGVNGWLGLIGLAAWLGKIEYLVAAIVLPAIVLIVWMAVHGRLPEQLIQWFVSRKHGGHVAPFLDTWKTLTAPRPIAVSVLLALAKTLIMAVKFSVLLYAYGEPVNAGLVVLLQAVVRLVAMLPISPSGMGVRELSGAILLTEWAGVSAPVAVNVMLLAMLFQMIVGVCCYFGNIKLFEQETEETPEDGE